VKELSRVKRDAFMLCLSSEGGRRHDDSQQHRY
jgi:hypothetical protein